MALSWGTKYPAKVFYLFSQHVNLRYAWNITTTDTTDCWIKSGSRSVRQGHVHHQKWLKISYVSPLATVHKIWCWDSFSELGILIQISPYKYVEIHTGTTYLGIIMQRGPVFSGPVLVIVDIIMMTDNSKLIDRVGNLIFVAKIHNLTYVRTVY